MFRQVSKVENIKSGIMRLTHILQQNRNMSVRISGHGVHGYLLTENEKLLYRAVSYEHPLNRDVEPRNPTPLGVQLKLSEHVNTNSGRLVSCTKDLGSAANRANDFIDFNKNYRPYLSFVTVLTMIMPKIIMDTERLPNNDYAYEQEVTVGKVDKELIVRAIYMDGKKESTVTENTKLDKSAPFSIQINSLNRNEEIKIDNFLREVGRLQKMMSTITADEAKALVPALEQVAKQHQIPEEFKGHFLLTEKDSAIKDIPSLQRAAVLLFTAELTRICDAAKSKKAVDATVSVSSEDNTRRFR
jgi:hypothetical protein